jgi:precorrin-6A/cobalt-precorrin-6A reductase
VIGQEQPLAPAGQGPNVAAMTGGSDILLLAGSAEARQIGAALRDRGIGVRALMSEPPRGSNPMPMPFALHDFNDLAGLTAQMQSCRAVVDASHGFDGIMTQQGFLAARQAGLPFVSLSRPSWDVGAGRNLQAAADVRIANAMIPAGGRVFSATGWASLSDYLPFAGSKLFLRQTGRHGRAAPYDFVELVFGDPPFTVADEIALFEKLGVEVLICRNLGGVPSRPKVDAAEALGLTTILIDRPAPPQGALVVRDVGAILDWVAEL